ncbi:NACHT domain-containing NTPase [Lentzea sp. CC55]|uniref:NACHT domain-containing protein n=1 Tax=Lentzea sp. CC55 TaxID=2884909 RepID=UPI001F32F662|nr:hypothetical protein [Lentzea sp. CC55]MCG8925055.1 hypothetical protein [Lentzea sp. CC55]
MNERDGHAVSVEADAVGFLSRLDEVRRYVNQGGAELRKYLSELTSRCAVTPHYVPQAVVVRHDGQPAERSTPRPASTAVFTAGRVAVVLGDPGGGKTELLQRHLHDVWCEGARPGALPVLVSATSLGAALFEAPFFAQAPAPGVQWMVLLDGLDEITHARARRDVVRDALRWSSDQPENRRLVITTRHLSDQERSDLGGAAPVYFELLRFEAGDFRELAVAWLGPERAHDLVQAVDESGLTDLVTLPMIGSIICRLRETNPGHPLGGTRGQIYDDFMTHLMAPTPRTETRSEHHAGERDDVRSPAWLSPAVKEQVLTLGTLAPADMRALLARVAARRRESSQPPPVLDVLLGEEPTRRHAGVPVRWWKEELTACFRRSGVLEQQGDELVFAHLTYEEFLAACHVSDTPERGAAELKRVLYSHRHRHWPWRPAPGYSRLGGWGRRLWTTARDENLSYLGFLIDRVTDAAADDLAALVSSQGTTGCRFLAAQKRLGTYIPADVQARAVEKLSKHMKVSRRAQDWASIDLEAVNELDPNSVPMGETLRALAIDDSRVHSATALLAFPESRADGVAALWELGRSPRLTSAHGRLDAAVAILTTRDESALDLLFELARNSQLEDDVRVEAVWRIAEHRPRSCLDLLDDWLDSDTGSDEFWFLAAKTTLALDEEHGVARLKEIAHDLSRPALKRINAANLLARRQEPQGAEALVRFARASGLDEGLRLSAVSLLVEIAHPEAAAIRAELVAEPGLKRHTRRYLRRLALPGDLPAEPGTP